MQKSMFTKGQVLNFKRETIEINKVYRPGHPEASENSYFYLINSSDIGEDTVSEPRLIEIVNELRAIN